MSYAFCKNITIKKLKSHDGVWCGVLGVEITAHTGALI